MDQSNNTNTLDPPRRDEIINLLNHRIAELIATVNSLTMQFKEQATTIRLLTAERDARNMLEAENSSPNSDTVVSRRPQQVKRKKPSNNNASKDSFTHNRFAVLEVNEADNTQDGQTIMDITETDHLYQQNADRYREIEPTQTKETLLPAPSFSMTPNQSTTAFTQRPRTVTLSQQQNPDANTEKVPPINIQDKTAWENVSRMFKNKHINFKHAKNTNDGIRIQLADSDSHRAATKLLREQNIGFYTFTTKDEAKLRVVIRGIPEHYTQEEIKEDLELQGFHPEAVFRMKNDKRPLPLVLAILPRDEKEIFNIKSVKHFIVRTETQRLRSSVNQCHRCQRFGHSQRNCTLTPRCVKCAENHIHIDCTKPSNIPVKCANCGGPHPASYRVCSRAPKKNANNTTNYQQENRSYAQVTRSSQSTEVSPDTSIILQSLLKQILEVAQKFDVKLDP